MKTIAYRRVLITAFTIILAVGSICQFGHSAPATQSSLAGIRQAADRGDAAAQFKEALSFDPSYPEAHLGLAAALERQGNPAEANAERQKAQSLTPSPATMPKP